MGIKPKIPLYIVSKSQYNYLRMAKKFSYSIVLFLVLIGAILEFGNLLNGVPKDKVIAIGYFGAFFYTLLFGLILRNIIYNISAGILNKRIFFTIVGTIGAVFMEGLIWLVQVELKTTGAAISPNLWLDLIMTVPFYTLLCYFLSSVVLKYKFPWQAIALAGGFYELMADGVVGNLAQLNIAGVFMSPILLPIFVVTYSPIILIPFLILPKNHSAIKPVGKEYLVLITPAKAALILPFSIGTGLFISQIFK